MEARKEQETLEVQEKEKTVENQNIRVEKNASIQQGSEERTEKLNEVLVENVEEVLVSVTETEDERVVEQVVGSNEAVAIKTGATTNRNCNSERKGMSRCFTREVESLSFEK